MIKSIIITSLLFVTFCAPDVPFKPHFPEKQEIVVRVIVNKSTDTTKRKVLWVRHEDQNSYQPVYLDTNYTANLHYISQLPCYIVAYYPVMSDFNNVVHDTLHAHGDTVWHVRH